MSIEKYGRKYTKLFLFDSFMSICYIYHLKISTINVFPLMGKIYSILTLIPMALFKLSVQTTRCQFFVH